jgi:hypothetical protein
MAVFVNKYDNYNSLAAAVLTQNTRSPAAFRGGFRLETKRADEVNRPPAEDSF